ncbi:hypothetical protein SVAN01_08182 [Stagonosporopsis vannaccii]|nr:hypothetical protein SVAN01_08182 [Stagonosporopsis vannaccii]
MDKERITYLNGIIDRLVQLSTEERTAALTHLYNLRTAAVEDLSDLSDNQRHWDVVLGSSSSPDQATLLVRDLVQLTDDELAIVGMQVTEKSTVAHEQALLSADDLERAKLQAQLAASAKQSVASLLPTRPAANTNRARESYNAARQGLDMKHKAKLVAKMRDVRDEIEHGFNTGQDVTTLEEVFDRIEQEFWEHYSGSLEETRIKTEEN